jgi:hypothetical protein
MQDYIIDTDSTITFSVRYKGQLILEEDYVPDARYQVRIRRLGAFCGLALWGEWCTADTTPQPDAAGTFTFLINGVEDASCFVIYSCRKTRTDAAAGGFLSEVTRKVTRPECSEYISVLTGAAVVVSIGGLQEGDALLLSTGAATGLTVYTFDVSYRRIAALFPDEEEITSYQVRTMNRVFNFRVSRTPLLQLWQFRYKNAYDMPETVHATGTLTMTAAGESTTGVMYGVERRFNVRPADEYVVKSGSLYYGSDYLLWYGLIHAREAEFLLDGEWVPVIVSKHKMEQTPGAPTLKEIEVTFKLAER